MVRYGQTHKHAQIWFKWGGIQADGFHQIIPCKGTKALEKKCHFLVAVSQSR